MVIRFNNRSVPEAGVCYSASSFISNRLKWTSGSAYWSVYGSWHLINTYALALGLRRCILTGNRTSRVQGTLCSPLGSNVLTDERMKSGSGPVEALVLEAGTEPAVGSYGGQLCKRVPLSLWSPALCLTPRCTWSSLSVTEITPAEALHFPVPVHRSDYTAQWKTAGFNLYLWRQCSSSLPFYSAHFVTGSLICALLCTLSHPLHLPHSWQSFSCLLLSPPHPHSLPFFQPPLCSHSRVALYPTSEYQHSLSPIKWEKNNDLFFGPQPAEWPLPSPLSALPVPFFYFSFFPLHCKVSSTLFHLFVVLHFPVELLYKLQHYLPIHQRTRQSYSRQWAHTEAVFVHWSQKQSCPQWLIAQ